MGVARTPEAKTADGVRLEEQIINSTTFEKYRREELPLSGPKLIVTSNKLVYPGDIEDIKIKLDDAFWVLLDPYIDDSSGKRLYYVLCAEDKKSMYETYQKKINPANRKEFLLLLLGNVEKIEYDDKNIILCKIKINNKKGRQIVKLNDGICMEKKEKVIAG